MRRLLLLLPFLLPLAAHAETPVSGSFVANAACPAYLSISKQSNPGNVLTVVRQTYQVLAGNKTPPTHFRLAIPGVSDPRWVAVECGSLDGQPAVSAPAPRPAQPIIPPTTPVAPGKAYLLAVSWEPAFCEARPNKPECRNLTASRYDATHFALHGLWPQPRDNEFCGVSGADIANSETNWRALPQVDLSTGLRTRLDRVMPGTRSQLDRHEWTRHGTCYGTTAERYFSDAVELMDQLNSSAVATLFADNIGHTLTLRSIRQAFEQSFGRDAGLRVSMECDDNDPPLITGLDINLAGASGQSLPALIGNARTVQGGCGAGLVDQAGF